MSRIGRLDKCKKLIREIMEEWNNGILQD